MKAKEFPQPTPVSLNTDIKAGNAFYLLKPILSFCRNVFFNVKTMAIIKPTVTD